MTNAVDRWTWPVYFAAIRAEASWKTLLPCVKDPAQVVDHLRSRRRVCLMPFLPRGTPLPLAA
jgi:hypothetical protein